MQGFENCLWVYLVERTLTGRRFIACSRSEIADAIGIPEGDLDARCRVSGWRICRVPRVFVGMVYGNAEYLCRDEQWNLYTLGGAPCPKEDVVQGSMIEITFEFYDRELDGMLERAEELGIC